MSVDITAVSSLKHADLWDAAKKLGGQSALARHIGICPSTVGRWCALKDVPNWEKWPAEKRADIERKLFVLTDKTLEELFPPELRDAAEFLAAPKQFEQRKTFERDALLAYARTARNRLAPPPPLALIEHGELREDIVKVLQKLSFREREIIELRFGLGDNKGYAYTLEEVGHIFKISRDRVRQIEMKGLGKLQKGDLRKLLVEHADAPSPEPEPNRGYVPPAYYPNHPFEKEEPRAPNTPIPAANVTATSAIRRLEDSVRIVEVPTP